MNLRFPELIRKLKPSKPAPPELPAARRSAMEHLPRVRVAVIGAGRIMPRHLAVLSAMPNVELTAIVSRGGPSAQELATQFGIRRQLTSVPALFERDAPDAVLVAVPPAASFEILKACLEHEVAILAEKPIALTLADARTLASLAEKRRSVAMVAMNRRYFSILAQAEVEIARRGPLLGVTIDAPEAIRRLRSRNDHPAEVYDDWLHLNSIHAIDLLRRFGGDVEHLSGHRVAREEKNGDGFVASLSFRTGAIGTFTAQWLSVPGWTFTLHGDGVRAVITGELTGRIEAGDPPVSSPLSPDPVDRAFKPGFWAQAEAFVTRAALGGSLGSPASDFADACKTMELVDGIAHLPLVGSVRGRSDF